MNRRQFISAAAGSLLFPAHHIGANQHSTPAPAPAHHGRPRPIVLGDGIELIDYRIYPSGDVPRIIGEIASTRDDMVDSPVVSITFPDLGKDGLVWAPSVLPVMRPGESNMIFGVLPEQIDTEERLETAEFGLCSPVTSGALTELHAPLNLRIEVVNESPVDIGRFIEAVVHNDAGTLVPWTKIRGLVRDSHGRMAGAIGEIDMWSLAPHSSAPFGVWLTPDDEIAANPFRILQDSSAFSTELFPGTVGNIVNPGCASLIKVN